MDENNQQQPPPPPTTIYPPGSAATIIPHPPPIAGEGASYHHLFQQQHQQLQKFWGYQRQEIEHVNDFKNHQLPLARIKKIMKADEDVRMISAEAPILFAKACELFILELTIRSWLHAEENKRRTLQKNDIAVAITRTEIFDFLVDIVPKEEIKEEEEEGGETAFGGGMVAPVATGVPYYYTPMNHHHPTVPGAMMIGTPVMDPTGVYGQNQSQSWQSVWQNSNAGDDVSYGSGGSNSHGNLDNQS